MSSLQGHVFEANARVLSAFLDYLKVEKGLAPLTVSAYTTDICQFAEFLEAPQACADQCAAQRCARFHPATVFEWSGWALGGTQAFGSAASVPAFAGGGED